jgi:hypothetical protein
MKQPRCAAYSRVSGSGQNPEMQIKELQAYCRSRGWKIAGEYCDRVSGASDSRPELELPNRHDIETSTVSVCHESVGWTPWSMAAKSVGPPA